MLLTLVRRFYGHGFLHVRHVALSHKHKLTLWAHTLPLLLYSNTVSSSYSIIHCSFSPSSIISTFITLLSSILPFLSVAVGHSFTPVSSFQCRRTPRQKTSFLSVCTFFFKFCTTARLTLSERAVVSLVCLLVFCVCGVLSF